MDNDLRLKVKHKVSELYDSLSSDEKYCNGCVFLDIKPPYKGITTADVNVWRDSYKCTCEQFTMAWTSTKKDKVARIMECIVTDGKCVN